MLDMFCGRFGWGKAFAARGWEVFGIDLVEPPEIPPGCDFVRADILDLNYSLALYIPGQAVHFGCFDFICASSPCEQFSVHGMKHFHPNPPYPELGIQLFNHTRFLCEASGVPYVMENVRAAQAFVGNAVNHCGPFYLWGTGVPPIMPQGISKGTTRQMGLTADGRRIVEGPRKYASGSAGRAIEVAKRATIPPELANCVADYAERLLEQGVTL